MNKIITTSYEPSFVDEELDTTRVNALTESPPYKDVVVPESWIVNDLRTGKSNVYASFNTMSEELDSLITIAEEDGYTKFKTTKDHEGNLTVRASR